MTIAAPSFEWLELSPLLIVLVGACIGVLFEAVLPRRWRFNAQLALLVVTLVAAFAMLLVNWGNGATGLLAMGSVTLDGPAYIAWGALLVFGLLSILVFAERQLDNGATAFAAAASSVPGSNLEADASAARLEHSEVYPLALFSLAGMMVFAASNDLLTMFVALEVMSLPLYLMSAMARRRRLLSQEAGLKYFLLGAFSSAFFLFGMALLYGYAGSFELRAIDAAITAPTYGPGILYTGMAMLAVGVLFKIGAVPFHSWIPDVYVGAPTPVTGFMAICTKLAAVAGGARVFFVALGAERWAWQPVLAVIAVLTMAVGAVLALTQTDIKRMLAYSSVAHAGFLLVAIVGALSEVPGGQVNSVGAIMFYLIAYGFAVVAAFAILTMVRGNAGEVNTLAGWSGLGRSNPVLAGIFAFLMLSFAGIPLTGGFIGKWAVFSAAWRGGYAWLVLAAVVFSLVAAYFYIRVIVVMFFGEPNRSVVVGRASGMTWVPVAVGAAASVYLGLFPGPLLDLLAQAEVFLR
ncbi:MAG: NADH-quinone oxidoreductase subunit NuoN [Propionicimonas sp.]